jgi:hypothetical protein
MAQLDLFSCGEKKIRFAKHLFQFGFKMIPNLKYESNSYSTISSLKEYETYVMTNMLMFIVHADTFSYELEMNSYQKEDSLLYYIAQRHGGPTIEFYSPGMIETRDRLIGPGFLGNYPFFYHKNEKVARTQRDTDFFGMHAKHIKKESKRVKFKSRNYWIGNRTIELSKQDNYNLVDFNGVNLIDLIT